MRSDVHGHTVDGQTSNEEDLVGIKYTLMLLILTKLRRRASKNCKYCRVHSLCDTAQPASLKIVLKKTMLCRTQEK